MPQAQTITNIAAASSAVAQLPAAVQVTLPGGATIPVARLSWLQFEAVWLELSALLAAIADCPADAAPEQLAQALSTAPSCVLKLCCLCAPLTEAELAALPYDAVLELAAAALELNFIAPAGVRRFFTALGRLPAALGV